MVRFLRNIQRIQKRNRPSEDKINIEYLNKLHELHENNICELSKKLLKDKIIIINVENKTIANIANELYDSIKIIINS